MVLSMLFGVLILFVVVYITFRVLGNMLFGVVLILLIFIASYLILGSYPNLKEVPIIGRWLPDLSRLQTTGSAISVMRGVFYNLEVLDYAHTWSGNMLVVVANRGTMDLNGYNVTVDGRAVDILNDPNGTLASGESAAIEVGWRGGFESIRVDTDNAVAVYPAD